MLFRSHPGVDRGQHGLRQVARLHDHERVEVLRDGLALGVDAAKIEERLESLDGGGNIAAHGVHRVVLRREGQRAEQADGGLLAATDRGDGAGDLVLEEGLLVGGSAGTNVVAALRVAATATAPVVTILPDGWDRYRSKPWMEGW